MVFPNQELSLSSLEAAAGERTFQRQIASSALVLDANLSYGQHPTGHFDSIGVQKFCLVSKARLLFHEGVRNRTDQLV
jgi:hypothetical protein